jgi:ubiquinone/menaquinone biosynthesis C-methylase UbiE
MTKRQPGSPRPQRGAPRRAPSAAARPSRQRAAGYRPAEGWEGWDEYAPFYDWENARTIGRKDVPFWCDLARRLGGPVLELGCGTGRVSLPVGRAGVRVVGIDRSEGMLARARQRVRLTRLSSRISLVRGDIRALPFVTPGPFSLVMAPYGILQSLVRESDLAATLKSVASVVQPGGTFGIDLVPDLPAWGEYRRRLCLHGRRGSGGTYLTLIESVRQDRRLKLTIFDQEYVEQRGTRSRHHRFSLVFRTLSVPQMVERLERAGFRITAVLGDYAGRAWDSRADVWVVLATRPSYS